LLPGINAANQCSSFWSQSVLENFELKPPAHFAGALK